MLHFAKNLQLCSASIVKPECLWGMGTITLLFRQETEQGFLHLKHSQFYCKVCRTSCQTEAVPKTQRKIVSLCFRKFTLAFRTAKLSVVSFAFYQEEGAFCSKELLMVCGVLGPGCFWGVIFFFFGSWCTLFLGGPWALWPGLTLLSWEHSQKSDKGERQPVWSSVVCGLASPHQSGQIDLLLLFGFVLSLLSLLCLF